MWAKKSGDTIKSSFVRAAQRLGLLDDDQAAEADALVSADDEHASQDIVVEAGFLTDSQVAIIDEDRKVEDVEGHLEDQFKRASLAIGDAKTSAEDLIDATQPLKKVSIG